MDKSTIQDYIKKLMDLNETINKGEKGKGLDDQFFKNLNDVISSLDKDIKDVTGKKFEEIFKLKVKIKKLRENAVIPTYSVDGDAGMDLTVTHIISDDPYSITYGYGIAIEIPKGYVGLVFPRSSIRKLSLLLTNSVGVIDSGYRGEIQSTFKKVWGNDRYEIGERAAQIIIIPYPKVEFIETDELSDTKRNDGGFGSTGV